MHSILYQQVIDWIETGASVLDLGTGDGSFLKELVDAKQVAGEGVEINPDLVASCIEKGLIVHQGDIMDGMDQYHSDAFDYILLLGTFEELEDTERVLREAFRVGKKVIISYRNFSHWEIRLQIMFKGKAPITRAMPYAWYNTPTKHFFSILDYQSFCDTMQLSELRTAYFTGNHPIKVRPNLRAETALSLLIQQD